ncbi:hypothetical protein Ga0061079_1262 [Apibacter mensalis]|uniref:Uncharacterized protein n=1 Tax=Apibacter mensalis TaxID=1586267 RepID=A0A0X3AS60_9FLAO|nr:hypothetical protein [Apibacter mensalis]CVK17226.1 hypothetical protein Ga0061079_1262 [Apibacter mensalis]
MNNEHNPIALRINRIQQKWKDKIQGKNYKVVRFLLEDEDDLPLINGFYKLESSIYRSIDEVLVVMLTDFVNSNEYSYLLAKDWIGEYEKNLSKHPNLPWKEFSEYKEKLQQANPEQLQGRLLIDLLSSYQKCMPNQTENLRIGIIPRKISSYQDFAKWIEKFAMQLPQGIGIVLTDYTQNLYYSRLMNNSNFSGCSLTVESQNMKDAYEELIKSGNPADPQVKFNTCMLEMGKKASEQNKKGVYHWGKKLLEIGQSTADKSIWASAHLIFAGFLFGFKDVNIHPLLDKGIAICQSQLKNNDTSSLSILLQLYNYKASYYSIENKPAKAWECFIKSTEEAMHHQHIMEAISSCKNAIIVAEKHFMKSDMNYYMENGFFKKVYSQGDEFIKATEFNFIANYYLSNSRILTQKEYQTINERMVNLYGHKWRHQAYSKLQASP